MSYVQKRNGRYRARYRDPLGRMTSATFDLKADAQGFLGEMETDKFRGTWIRPPARRGTAGPVVSGVPRPGPAAIPDHPADLPA